MMRSTVLDGQEFIDLLVGFAATFYPDGYDAAPEQRAAIRLFIRTNFIHGFDPLVPRGFDELDGDGFEDLLNRYAIAKFEGEHTDVVLAMSAIKEFVIRTADSWAGTDDEPAAQLT